MHKLPLKIVRLRKRSVVLVALISLVVYLKFGHRFSSPTVEPLPRLENISNSITSITIDGRLANGELAIETAAAVEPLELKDSSPSASKHKPIEDSDKFNVWQIAFDGFVKFNVESSTAQGCDTSAAPLNGEVGTCGNMLPDGASCQPSCHGGYARSGESTCLVGVLSAATCIVNQDVATNPLTDNTKAPSPVPSGYVATEDSSDGLPTATLGTTDTQREAIWKSFGKEDGVNIHAKPNGYHQHVEAFDRPCAGQLELVRAKRRPVVLSQEDRGNRLRYYETAKLAHKDHATQIWAGEPYSHDAHQHFFHMPTRKKALDAIEPFIQPKDPFVISSGRAHLYDSCAVVGNSGTLTTDLSDASGASGHGVSGRGTEIDGHEAVIRFHMAPTEGYEQHVGRRTTVRFLSNGGMQGKSYYDDFLKLALKNYTSLGKVVLRTSGRLGEGATIDLFRKLLTHVQEKTISQLVQANTYILHDDFYRQSWTCLMELIIFAKLKKWNFIEDKEVDISGNPSTGVVATIFALQKCKKVSLYGFGSFEGVPYKYYSPQDVCCPTNMHDMSTELDAMVLLGKLWIGENFRLVAPADSLRVKTKMSRADFNHANNGNKPVKKHVGKTTAARPVVKSGGKSYSEDSTDGPLASATGQNGKSARPGLTRGSHGRSAEYFLLISVVGGITLLIVVEAACKKNWFDVDEWAEMCFGNPVKPSSDQSFWQREFLIIQHKIHGSNSVQRLRCLLRANREGLQLHHKSGTKWTLKWLQIKDFSKSKKDVTFNSNTSTSCSSLTCGTTDVAQADRVMAAVIEMATKLAEERKARVKDPSNLTESHVYKTLRRAQLRASFELDSEAIGVMEKDETVMVFEEKTNSNGQVRVKCKDGWTSVTSQHGTTLLQRIDEGAQKDADEKKHAHFKTEAVTKVTVEKDLWVTEERSMHLANGHE